MSNVIDADTGEIIDDIRHYLEGYYKDSKSYRYDKFIDEHADLFDCLTFLCKVDGNITQAQRRLLHQYALDVMGDDRLTLDDAKHALKFTASDLSPAAFRTVVSRLKADRAEELQRVIEWGEILVRTRKSETLAGETFLNYAKKAK